MSTVEAKARPTNHSTTGPNLARGLAMVPRLCNLLLATILAQAAVAQVVLQTGDFRLKISAEGVVESLQAKSSGTEYAWTNASMPVACAYRGGTMALESQTEFLEDSAPLYRGGECINASGVSLVGQILTVSFAPANLKAIYQVTARSTYLAFKLVRLEGDPIDRIDLLQLRVKRLPFLGPWINVAYDEQFGICLCAGNIKTDAGMNQSAAFVEMRAIATRDVALEGATAVLLGLEQPRKNFLPRMEIVEKDFHLPPGAANRRLPVQDYSYLWCSPTPQDIDDYIGLARRGGFRMLFFSYTAFTKGAGHFVFDSRYPRGSADLKKVTDRIRAAGLKVGLHLHYSKAERTDSYVTPTPDPRLHSVRTFSLAAPLDQKADMIYVRENPEGCTMAQDRRILRLRSELISYDSYSTQPPYRFMGCERGHLQTIAKAHAAGEKMGLLDVDDWVKFIRFDQNTDIQDEVARRIAEIANTTGPYDLVYFDGAEDVHDPFWYHVANAQNRVYQLLQPPPPACEAAMSAHFSWHLMTRGNAFDVRAGHIKSFCREISCREAPVRAIDFTRINFGWIFDFYRDLAPDTVEYVLSRGAAWDCPISLRITRLSQIPANPRAEDCLEVIKTWEDARLSGQLTEAQRSVLKTLPTTEYCHIKTWEAIFTPKWSNAWSGPFHDQEHHLFRNEKGKYELVPVREEPNDTGRLKTFLFQRATEPGNTYMLLWDSQGESSLSLAIAPERITLMRPFGQAVPFEKDIHKVTLPMSTRRYLRFRDCQPTGALELLHGSSLRPRP